MLVNQFLIWFPFGRGWFRGLFSYQIYVRAQARPTVPALLAQTIETSEQLRAEIKQHAA